MLVFLEDAGRVWYKIPTPVQIMPSLFAKPALLTPVSLTPVVFVRFGASLARAFPLRVIARVLWSMESLL